MEMSGNRLKLNEGFIIKKTATYLIKTQTYASIIDRKVQCLLPLYNTDFVVKNGLSCGVKTVTPN